MNLFEFLASFAPAGAFVVSAFATYWFLGSVLVLGAGLLLRCRRGASAATRSRVWSAVLLAIVLLPAAVLIRDNVVTRAVAEGVDSLAALATTAAPLERATRGEQAPAPPATSFSGPSTAAALTSTASTANWLLPVAALGLIGLWIATALRRLARLGLALAEVRRLRENSRPADELSQQELRRLATSARLRKIPSSQVLVELDSPACVGAWRPWIALPADWPRGLSAQARQAALLHELAHLARRDAEWTFCQQILLMVLAPHPLTPWLTRRIALERECACDDWAMSMSHLTPTEYGSSLLDCAARFGTAESPSPLVAAWIPGGPSQLRKRVQNMSNPRRSHTASPSRTSLLLLLLLLAGAVLASASIWPTLPNLPSWAGSAVSAIAFQSDEYGARIVRSADDSPLYAAVRSGNPDLVRRLVDGGESPNEVWPGDGSPLIEAARRGDLEMARELLRLGAEVDLGVGGDGTPLINAASNGHADMVDLLLSHGADIDHHGRGGDGNPLIQASLRGQLELAQELVRRGARVDIHVEDDDTPLINAAQQGHLEVVRYLLEVGADPNLTGDYDRRLERVRTPLNQALARGHGDVAALLRSAGARE